ncbi:MAG TPA: MGMT family protein [Smithellaceae bacterium]|jgi:methylated-DNA-[protein]-cysteine S-methyltransferase|nr:MGMT family protein [Smithellaceae bacterium]HPB14920.1 MGMT family protein [Smithellaceae bacterium]HPI51122.1 MGMT family protein [Smithellaceae bacterium]HQG99371.1 MGMT family protein [Smithellaceae bacterium]HQH04504.1 MGMT family protein [Smithellaceae bacterium]
MYYQILKAASDEIGWVWKGAGKQVRLERIYLPGREKMIQRILRDFPAVGKRPRKISGGLDRLMVDLCLGKERRVDLSLLNLSGLTKFSARVLKETLGIPRGKVCAYSGLAERAGFPRAARAVGSVMANNPFPLAIPCHRVIRADGTTGHFGGGADMKKRLLEREGIPFDAAGRVPPAYLVVVGSPRRANGRS